MSKPSCAAAIVGPRDAPSALAARVPGVAEPEPIAPAGPELTFREYARHVPGVVWVGGVPWRLSGRVLRPLAMPHVAIAVDRDPLREAIARHRALLAYWTTDWDSPGSCEWWWTCCDRDGYGIESIDSARGRRSIRRGLRDCTVHRIEPAVFGRLAYPIHRAALESYGRRPPTEPEYARTMEGMAAYPGTEFWAAFHGDRMAAFATCQVIDGAVTLGTTKSDPELDRYNPNAALFYSITRHYLHNGIRYVSNGSRTLWHPTRINEFLARLGFRRIFCRVHVELSPLAGIIDKSRLVKSGRFLGLAKLARNKWATLEGFDRLVKIAKTFT